MPKILENHPQPTSHRSRIKALVGSAPTLFCDSMSVHVRSDGNVLIRWFVGLPEGQVEQCKIMTNKEHIKKIIEALCKVADHYPTKEEVKKTR